MRRVGLDRSREEIAAARLLAERGFAAQAVSRAYFGAFHAAEAALLSLGEVRSKHAGVVSVFNRRVVRDGGFDESVGRILRSLFDRRNQADYAPIQVPPDEADRSISDAERFVDAVEAWLTNRPV